MFTSIKINSFKSCRDLSLDDLSSMQILIGRNGVGKTNTMTAIMWASQFASVADDASGDEVFPARGFDGDVSLTFEVEGTTYKYRLFRQTSFTENTIQIKRALLENICVVEDDEDRIILERNGELVTLSSIDGDTQSIPIGEKAPSLPSLLSLLPEEHDFRSAATDIIGFLGAVKYYPLTNLEEHEELELITGETYRKWKTGSLEKKSFSLWVQCILIELHNEKRAVFEELNALLGSNGLNLIEEIKVDEHSFKTHVGEFRIFYFVQFFMPGIRSNIQDYSSLSFGTKRVLFLLISMLNDNASVSIIEQPEDGIHTALIKKLMGILRTYCVKSQYFISSHSASVLNMSNASEVRFVSMEDGYTEVRSLNEIELEAAKQFLEEDGSLAEFLESIED